MFSGILEKNTNKLRQIIEQGIMIGEKKIYIN